MAHRNRSSPPGTLARRAASSLPSLASTLSLALLLILSAAITGASALSPAFSFFGGSDSESDTPPGTRPLNALGQETYGVDVSFPIHHGKISTNFAWLPHNADPENNPTPKEYRGMPVQFLGDRQADYDTFIQGCKDHYEGDQKNGRRSPGVCATTERDRVEMSLRQPGAMQNYTDLGFKKMKAPPEVWEKIQKFWADNKDRKNWQPENWPRGNTYTNHWESPTYMVSVEDTRLRGAGSRLKQSVWDAARDTLQEWTGEELTACSMYGIRVYTEGALLSTHVDRMPLVTSAIINVDQDLDEPWPIEVYAHDGKAYNITMEPGDMVLYESHSVLHGRPFRMKGRHFANIFIHFEPTGHSLRHNAKEAAAHAEAGNHHERYKKDAAAGLGGHEAAESDGMPAYILHGSIEEERWRRSHPSNKRSARKDSFATGSTPAHRAAQKGDADELSTVIDKLEHLLDAKDANGWTPLHEGARGGHEEVVKLLLKKGAGVNERTMEGKGETPLYWSIKNNGEDHPVSLLLKEFGGLNIGPDL